MSIFGVKKYTSTLRALTDLNSRLQNVHTNADIVKQMTIKTKEKFENLKSNITISAETKGSLYIGEVFSFGNAGRQKDVGYVVMRRGHITGISLSSERSSGKVRVGVLLNGVVLRGCEITLHTTPSKHDNFAPRFFVDAGSVINFVSLEANGTAVNTVASLLIEFKK